MSTITGKKPEEIVRQLPRLTGSSRLITSEFFELQPVRSNLQLVTPAQDLDLCGRELTYWALKAAMKEHGFDGAHLAEIFHYVQHGLDGKFWNKYAKVAGLGQTAEEQVRGKILEYVPCLWGTGSIHHVGVKDIRETWTDSDQFLVVTMS